jgi:hypothetical protein
LLPSRRHRGRRDCDPTSFGYVGDGVEQQYVVPNGVTGSRSVNGPPRRAAVLGGCGWALGGGGARIVATIDVGPATS